MSTESEFAEIACQSLTIGSDNALELNLLDISNIHPLASGNKYFKLAPNFSCAKAQGFSRVLSFGGAFSNHIHALALYANQQGLESIGVIRGELEYANNPTLSAALEYGIKLVFVDRKTYQLRHEPEWFEQLQLQYPDCYIIPEGGSNVPAINGCRLLAKRINDITKHKPLDIIAVPCGTGGTLTGISCGLKEGQQAWGFKVLRDDSIEGRISTLQLEACHAHHPYRLIDADYGGYARFDKALLDFILQWLDNTGILLDPVYTSKMARKLMAMADAGEIAEGTQIGMIHTGGLQGWWGMRQKVIKLGGKPAWMRIRELLQP